MREPGLTLAEVKLWSHSVGSVSWDEARQLGHFTYSPQFRQSGLEVAPITMPLAQHTFSFPELNANVFKGLPGFLADSLPDKFGSAVIDAWLVQEGRHKSSLNPIERLCLIGAKGMGALEYSPAPVPVGNNGDGGRHQPLAMGALVRLINIILAAPKDPGSVIDHEDLREAMQVLLHTGTSAGGARAKAVIAWNPITTEACPGQLPAPEGFGYWLLKFDGITGNRDREADDPQGYGLIEYAYHLMAKQAGIDMTECQLLCENGRRHFMTRRFDRTPSGEKIHMQSLCAMGHMDYDAVGHYSYEQVMQIMRNLRLPQSALEQQFRRMVFNVLARNHDDHPKNIAFLMDPQGVWSLSPAYDLTFAYNPQGHWTSQHQMSLNGKRDKFVSADLRAVARRFSIADDRSADIVQKVAEAVAQWPQFALRAGVDTGTIDAIENDLRLDLTSR